VSVNSGALKRYLDGMESVLAPLRELPQPLVQGRACVSGTLISMNRETTKLINALAKRPATEKDRLDLARGLSTIVWLRDWDWVWKDLAGVKFSLGGDEPETDFQETMNALYKTVEAAEVPLEK